MAISDYICCSKCETKLFFDGDQGNRKWWKERFGSEVNIKCPKCSEWQGLTDEEGAEIWGDAHDIDWNRLITPKEIVKRIEAKLKEKNT